MPACSRKRSKHGAGRQLNPGGQACRREILLQKQQRVVWIERSVGMLGYARNETSFCFGLELNISG